MNQVEQTILTKVVKVLNSINLKYAIVDSDGNKHGDLNIEQEKKRKRCRSMYPLGEVRNYIKPYMRNLRVNTTQKIPVSKYAPESLRSSISSYATELWGSGNYTTHVGNDKGFVELTRLDPVVADFMRKDPLTELLDGFDELDELRLRKAAK